MTRPTRLQRRFKLLRLWLAREWRDNGMVIALCLSVGWLYLFWFGLLEMGR